MVLTEPFRAATPHDCRRIAALYRISSGGVADYLWQCLAEHFPGREPLDVGAAALAGDGVGPCFRDAVVAEREGDVAAVLLGRRSGGRWRAGDFEPVLASDAVLAPFRRLRAPGTWSIRAVSVDPCHQGQGLGTHLMRIARRLAFEQGCAELSAVVFEENAQCVRAFRRAGFVVRDRAALVPHPMIRFGGHALLVCAPVHF